MTMLDTHGGETSVDALPPVASASDVQAMVRLTRQIHVAPVLKGYIVDVANATRRHPAIALGVSPRASLALQRAARSFAASIGRDYVVPDDLKALAEPVLGHRLGLTPEAQISGIGPGQVLAEVLASVPVPTGRPATA
jgi:MoxR-like ATPase